MSNKIKGAIGLVVGILVLFAILTGTLGDIITSATDNASGIPSIAGVPDIIITIAGFWWVPVLVMLIAAILGGIKRSRGRSRRRRR